MTTTADETRMLRESAAALSAASFSTDQVRVLAEAPGGITEEAWQALVAQGWLGVLIPEDRGGLGLGSSHLGVILEELGRALVPGPFWSAATLGVPAVAWSENQELRDRWLEDLGSGSRRITLALQEDGALPSLDQLAVRAEPAGPGRYTLRGQKRFVPDLAGAAGVVVVAAGTDGPLAFLVESERAGIRIEENRTTDSTSRSGTLGLDGVTVGDQDLLGGPTLVDRLIQSGNVGIAAMASAAAQAVLDRAVAHAKERVQFEVPIGTFQAVQHPLVDALAEIESARSAYLYAAWAVDHQTTDLRRAVALARLTATRAYHRASVTSLQTHGGIAFTWEYDLHLHLKRAIHLEYLLGSPADYEELIAREGIGI